MEDADRQIATLIIGNLTDDGYLNLADTPLADLARQACEDLESPEVDEARVETVLRRVQQLDPVGVAARDLSECLLIQAKVMGMNDEVVTNIIQNHLHNLEKKNYQAIVKDLKVSLDDVIDAVKFMSELEPRPGRVYNTEEPHYITPDIHVYKIADEWV